MPPEEEYPEEEGLDEPDPDGDEQYPKPDHQVPEQEESDSVMPPDFQPSLPDDVEEDGDNG